ncbi:hypothetical protein IE81DRAFT_6242 [Ceraceosorus guamensis]|uniref:Chromo domain-containing protein n=1 Tax=Ceraceosorus guamensis TaxID=1522189 RepID=A0A316W8Y2_9BASI|nr:hypothetical protein IE81DRAFT_6242 [Ceraceosorus guamensis]PWN46376.1 hypothetical protein IE81DRAFT_6242 [Ceraceosorus guamensis]
MPTVSTKRQFCSPPKMTTTPKRSASADTSLRLRCSSIDHFDGFIAADVAAKDEADPVIVDCEMAKQASPMCGESDDEMVLSGKVTEDEAEAEAEAEYCTEEQQEPEAAVLDDENAGAPESEGDEDGKAQEAQDRDDNVLASPRRSQRARQTAHHFANSSWVPWQDLRNSRVTLEPERAAEPVARAPRVASPRKRPRGLKRKRGARGGGGSDAADASETAADAATESHAGAAGEGDQQGYGVEAILGHSYRFDELWFAVEWEDCDFGEGELTDGRPPTLQCRVSLIVSAFECDAALWQPAANLVTHCGNLVDEYKAMLAFKRWYRRWASRQAGEARRWARRFWNAQQGTNGPLSRVSTHGLVRHTSWWPTLTFVVIVTGAASRVR